jgi:hypothetical protein
MTQAHYAPASDLNVMHLASRRLILGARTLCNVTRRV